MGWAIEPGLRFLNYAVLLGMFGSTAFRLIALRSAHFLSVGNRMSLGLIGGAAAAFVLSVVLMLVSVAAMMGMPLSDLDWPTISMMAFGTDIGIAFAVRIILLFLALCFLVAVRATKLSQVAVAACFAAALLSLGWSGHAAAGEGGIGLLHRLNNGAHLIAAGLWLGAIICFVDLTVKLHRRPDREQALALLSQIHAFAPLGVGLVAVVAITGLINSQLIFGIQNSLVVLSTPYGLMLAAKLILVCGMVAFGANNAAIGRRFATSGEPSENSVHDVLARLRLSLGGELCLAVGVLGLVAVLGLASPGML